MKIAVLALAPITVLSLLACSDKKTSGTPIAQQTERATKGQEEPATADEPELVEPTAEVVEPKAENPEPKTKAPATAVDPGSLSSWAKPSSKATFLLHAADADTHLLSIAAADTNARLLGASSSAELVSGRLEVKSANAMWKGLLANAPGLSALLMKSSRGKGVRVDLSYWQVDPNDLMQLFAAVLGTNIVIPSVNKPMTIHFRRVPADEAQDALIKSLGWNKLRRGRTTFVTPEPWVADKKFDDGPKLKIDLDANGAKASDVLGLLSAASENKWTAACGAGKATSFRLRRESIGTMAATITLLSGEVLSKTGESCVEEATEIPRAKDKLVAIVSSGNKSAALFERAGSRAVVVRNGKSYGGKMASVGRGFVVIGSTPRGHRHSADDGFERALYPSENEHESLSEPEILKFYEQIGDLLRRSRLAATVVRPKNQAAIFERPSGQFFMVLIGEYGALELLGDVGFKPPPSHSAFMIMMRQPIGIEPGKVLIETTKLGQAPQTESIVLSKRP